jgi:hypothetical protein
MRASLATNPEPSGGGAEAAVKRESKAEEQQLLPHNAGELDN